LKTALSVAADIQPEVFDKLVSANSLREDGFLRRVVFAHADQTAHGNLPSLTAEQIEKLAGLLTKISARVDELKAYGYDHPAEIQFKPMNYQKALCPVIAGEAKALYDKFLKELNMAFKDDRIQGLAEYLRRDILLRTLFSDDYKTVSVEAVKQAIAWTRYQWEVRNHTWRESFDEKAAAMEAAITDTFKRYAAKCGKKYDLKQGMTRREVYVFGNLQRKGGLDHFNRTFMNMQGVHLIREVKKVKIKNHGDLPVYVRD
jgi:hypothetical protein